MRSRGTFDGWKCCLRTILGRYSDVFQGSGNRKWENEVFAATSVSSKVQCRAHVRFSHQTLSQESHGDSFLEWISDFAEIKAACGVQEQLCGVGNLKASYIFGSFFAISYLLKFLTVRQLRTQACGRLKHLKMNFRRISKGTVLTLN